MTAGRGPTALLRMAAWPDRYPGVALLLLILLATLGTILAAQLPAGRYATAAPAALQVRAELPGIDASTVQAAVTEPLEEALRGLPVSASIESRTREGQTELLLRFVTDAERDRALVDARTQIARMVSRLPATLAPPTVERHEWRRPAAVVYAITADDLSASVVQWVQRVLVEPLRELGSVASVAIEGPPEPEILIQPDARRVAAFGLSFDDLIQALRRQDQAPPRKRARRSVVMPGNVEAIAARAVRLPSGEPIALAEVAAVSLMQDQASARPRYRGAPALWLAVYPRAPSDVARVSERADAHLAWLRANDLIPPDVVVHVVHDEARATKQWLKRVAWRTVLLLAGALLVVAALYGLRRCVLLACAYGVWLPVAAALLWFFGFTLNSMTAAAWMLACVPFTVMVAGPRFGGFAVFAVAAAALVGLLGLSLGAGGQLSYAFAVVVLAGVFVAWLITPWMHRRNAVKPLLTQRLPKRWRGPSEALAVGTLASVVLLIAFLNVRALIDGNETQDGGDVIMRVGGRELEDLIGVGDELSQSLAKLIGPSNVSFSAARVPGWRLQLDGARAADVGIGLAEIGRALAIARDGLVVGEIVHGETLYRLRLRLPAGVAGEQFERLVLRGEQRNQPVVYLRDVGIALRDMQPRELLRVDGRPVIEITGHWSSKAAGEAVERFCRDANLPEGYKRECHAAEGFRRMAAEKDF